MEANCAKRNLGAYYTPEALSDILCGWAIREATDRVFEPSFGGCGFLKSAATALRNCGQKSPENQIYGCDVDESAFGYLQDVFSKPVDTKRFFLGDFLTFEKPDRWPRAFEAVVGNPPYLPYRKIENSAKAEARSKLSSVGFDLDLRASLWAYFVALSAFEVAPGGRMAWVLPSSFLHANYANDLREFLIGLFSKLHAFEIEERLFLSDGTEEKSIVLLGAGKIGAASANTNKIDSDISLTRCSGLDDLKLAVADWDRGLGDASISCGSAVQDSLPRPVRILLSRLDSLKECTSVGGLLDIRIGLVTGNNKFFVLDENARRDLGLTSSELSRVVGKFKFVPGISFSEDDHDDLLESGGRGYLVSCTEESRASPNLKAYLATYSREDRKSCATFKKRAVWSAPDDKNPPDAFFPVMHHAGPRLVLNVAGLPCTNTIHRAFFKHGTSEQTKRLACVSLLSTFSQLSSESVGRSYGAGVLKHEPREAERIRLLMPKVHGNAVNAAYARCDRLLRTGDTEAARRAADELLFSALKRSGSEQEIKILDSTLSRVRAIRHR